MGEELSKKLVPHIEIMNNETIGIRNEYIHRGIPCDQIRIMMNMKY